MGYAQHFSTKVTPQSEPIPGKQMVKNDAGGYVFALDDWKRLERFLILGAEGGTYYVDEHRLSVDNANVVARCLKEDGTRTVDMIVDVSKNGRAPSNDPALFALAMASSPTFAGPATRSYALSSLREVARIGTHWFHFAREVDQLRGWGRSLRDGIASLYNDSADRLAYQCVKYQQRDGWSHRDLLRLSHPVPTTVAHDRLFEWITQGNLQEDAPLLVHGYVAAQKATDAKEVVRLIKEYGLTREMVPTQFLNDKEVWEALLEKMPMTAMIRNLGKMTSIGVIGPMRVGKVVNALNSDAVRKARVHPLNILVALKTYQQGKGMRGGLRWRPIPQVVDALDAAFYNAFGNVESTGKRTMLALDVSGSMVAPLSKLPLECREAAAAMAMVIARTEPNYMVTIFSSAGMNFFGKRSGGRFGWLEDGISSFDISPRERMDDIVKRTCRLPFGGTDCALPMLYALKNMIAIDTFIVITDNQTWAGTVHPTQALNKYRAEMDIPAKLVVVGMTSSGFSIADPNDAGMLDVVGFDTATPNVISNFVR